MTITLSIRLLLNTGHKPIVQIDAGAGLLILLLHEAGNTNQGKVKVELKFKTQKAHLLSHSGDPKTIVASFYSSITVVRKTLGEVPTFKSVSEVSYFLLKNLAITILNPTQHSIKF